MAATRRNQPGVTTADDFNDFDELELEEMESSLCVQQWLQQQLFSDPDNVHALMKLPRNTDALVFQVCGFVFRNCLVR